MSWWDYVKRAGLAVGTGGLSEAYGARPLMEGAGQIDLGLTDPFAKQSDPRQALGDEQARQAGLFANQGQANYGQMTAESQAQRDYLGRLARGEDSVSAEQLRQNTGAMQAGQLGMAAGARPNNAAMAARTAMMNVGRLGYGMSGQQALAGLQERQNAHNALLQSIMQQRAQDANVALNSRGNSIQGYGGPDQAQSWWDKYGQGTMNAAAAAGSMAAKSDRRSKKEIEDGDEDAEKAIRALKAYSFKYKNEKDGKGKQVGVMAQDLEKAGLRHTVIDTPDGKYVHGAKLATSNTAMIAALGRRLSKLEGKRQ